MFNFDYLKFLKPIKPKPLICLQRKIFSKLQPMDLLLRL